MSTDDSSGMTVAQLQSELDEHPDGASVTSVDPDTGEVELAPPAERAAADIRAELQPAGDNEPEVEAVTDSEVNIRCYTGTSNIRLYTEDLRTIVSATDVRLALLCIASTQAENEGGHVARLRLKCGEAAEQCPVQLN